MVNFGSGDSPSSESGILFASDEADKFIDHRNYSEWSTKELIDEIKKLKKRKK